MAGNVAYWNDPDAVVWVDLPHRRLQGFDNYWVDWPRYGMWNDAENVGIMYQGRSAVAFEDRGDHEVEIDPTPPDGAHILRGVMLTPTQAEFVGLI